MTMGHPSRVRAFESWPVVSGFTTGRLHHIGRKPMAWLNGLCATSGKSPSVHRQKDDHGNRSSTRSLGPIAQHHTRQQGCLQQTFCMGNHHEQNFQKLVWRDDDSDKLCITDADAKGKMKEYADGWRNSQTYRLEARSWWRTLYARVSMERWYPCSSLNHLSCGKEQVIDSGWKGTRGQGEKYEPFPPFDNTSCRQQSDDNTGCRQQSNDLSSMSSGGQRKHWSATLTSISVGTKGP